MPLPQATSIQPLIPWLLLMKKHLNTLYITTDDTWLAQDGETISVRVPGRPAVRIPFLNLEAIQTFGWNIIATPQLMAKCVEEKISLSFCTPFGKFLCRVCGFTSGNVLLRRVQYRLADDPLRALHIARNMVAAKILNARTILQRFCRDYPDKLQPLASTRHELAYFAQQSRNAETPSQLLGIEGAAAEAYFRAFPHFFLTDALTFYSRSRRPPLDPVNALLSFTYSLLTADCKSALEAVGLDSAVGYYHRERPGRPSLALDLMEEFRAPLADRMVLSLINRKQISAKDFIHENNGAVCLTDDARRLVLTSWQERKKDVIEHPYLREKMPIGMLTHIQARLLAQHIRGALDAYPPMIWK